MAGGPGGDEGEWEMTFCCWKASLMSGPASYCGRLSSGGHGYTRHRAWMEPG